VSVDGAAGKTFNGTKAAYTPQVALYHADSLGAGQHTIDLLAQPAVPGQALAIDYAQIAPPSASSAAPSTTVTKKSK
jgi:hypothetical protein